jgi:hypothetical protein
MVSMKKGVGIAGGFEKASAQMDRIEEAKKLADRMKM